MMAKGTYAGIILATADLDGTFERLQAGDAEVVQEPTEQPYGVRDCAFRDPAGNLIRIQELRSGGRGAPYRDQAADRHHREHDQRRDRLGRAQVAERAAERRVGEGARRGPERSGGGEGGERDRGQPRRVVDELYGTPGTMRA